MPIPSAERSFREGLAALASARPLHAADRFLDAMQIEQRQGVHHPDMRCLSYYGLSLARAGQVAHAALEACELAVRDDPSDPVLLLNLGRVHLLAGRREAALPCFERGLRIAPDHRALRVELGRIDRRSRRMVRWLARSHPLNRWMGKLRESLRARTGARAWAAGTRSP
jgi:tetratricopeptide (TPR) repeat protein